MTEYQIEERVAAMFDDIDKRYLSSSSMTAAEYHKLCECVTAWAEERYRERYPGWASK